MRGPIVSITCHEPDRPDLASRLRSAAAEAGVTAWATDAAGTEGTVAVLEVPVGDLGLGPVDDSADWADVSARLGTILDEVSPVLALGGFVPVLDLDDPVWRNDRAEWASGRLEVDRLDIERRVAFNALVDERMVEVRDGAVRWATPPGVPLGVGLLDVPPLLLSAATFEAWTGTPADLDATGDAVDLAEVNRPELWCWAAPGDVGGTSGLAGRIAAVLPGHRVRVGEEYGPFDVVRVEQPPARGLPELDALVADLRAAVAAAAPTWAAILPRGGFLPPGLSPQTPEASVVDHLWLREDWAGSVTAAVRDTLDPLEPEAVGDGLLFVTGPGRGDTAEDLLWTPMVRHGLLVEVARLLGDRVEQDVAGPGIRL